MLLKYAKCANGVHKCSLVQAATELRVDVHAAHEELLALQAAGVLRVELQDVALYVRLRYAPTPAELRNLAVALCARMRAIDALQLAKLDACASLLWSLANGELIDAKLSAYFGPRYEETQWAAPVALGAPVGGDGRLRGDLTDLIGGQLSAAVKPGKLQAKLTGRAVARIMHGLSSPAFPYKEHSRSKYWGMHKSVAFDRVKAMAEEVLETARRRMRQQEAALQARERARKRKEPGA
mmetsp:Transcript_31700/g.101075  ORF Transcript_31700/g.101075 Transcript_31700/m.101075 type:complete len:238 (+) Transcript_31700:136-849(+)